MQMLVCLHVNKTNFHMKGFAPGLALKLRRKATRKLPIHLLDAPKEDSVRNLLKTCH